MLLKEKFDASKGRPSGFDYMRFILASGVVFWHSIVVTYGVDFQNKVWVTPIYHIFLAWLLPSFFALSGFLVAGSLERCNTLTGFLFLRVIRIFPALIVEITLSALVLGPAMTIFTLRQYFHDPELYQYFLNCVGNIHYLLPGLFLHNPLPATVNAQLWTVPYELICYLSLGLLGILGVTHRPRLFMLVVFALYACLCVDFVVEPHHPSAGLNGDELVMCFLFGVLYYTFRGKIPHDIRLFAIAMAASVYTLWIPGGGLLAALPVAYVTVFLGITNPRKVKFLDTGDYSYGIFLYGFPIEQAIAGLNFFPLNGWLTLAVAYPLIVLLAICSWHFWEKRMLGLRRFRPAIDKIFGFTEPGRIPRYIYRFVRAEP